MSEDAVRHALRVLMLADASALGSVSAVDRPDVIIVQCAAESATCRAMATAFPATPLIVVADVDEQVAVRLVEEGADAVVPTSTTIESIAQAARDAIMVQRPKRAHEQLPPQLQALGRLAGGVAHDFNNLLLVIDGNVERLMRALPSREPLRRPVHAIAAASRRAAELTRQLLAFGRGQTLIPAVIDLNATIDELLPIIRRQLGPTFDIMTRLSPDLPAIRADRAQVIAALTNLIANAVQSMPRGGTITIATDATEADAHMRVRHPWLTPGAFVRVQVTDCGPLMDSDTLERLFEPFGNRAGEPGTTSLALSSVYGIVKQSGGFIWAEPGDTSGTTIVMLFPPSHRDQPIESSNRIGGPTCNRVLLVEDDEAVREFLVESLSRHGFVVEMATSAEEALEHWSSARFDLLVTDVVLPGIDGRQLAQQVRSMSAGTPILFMSGYTGDLLEDGDVDSSRAFLQKPFTSATLVDRVRELIGTSS